VSTWDALGITLGTSREVRLEPRCSAGAVGAFWGCLVILCEPFAGMAGVSFWTLGCKPPISWMGGKSGYSRVIAELLGLSRLNPPRAYVWGDVGPNIAALACLFGAAGSAEEVARWVWLASQSYRPGNIDSGMYSRTNGNQAVSTSEVAAAVAALPRAPEVAAIIRGWRDEEPRALWTRLKAAGWPSLLLPEGSGGRWLGPCDLGEVAAWLWVSGHENPHGSDLAPQYIEGWKERRAADSRSWAKEPTDWLAQRAAALPTKPPMVACWQGRAEDMRLPERLDGWIMYMDPPYENTTGYKHGGCPRETVLRLALDWSARGATVAISEAVRLDDALPGWYAVQIDGERVGQKRTFSKQQHEWVTMNRKPVVVPGVQASLFGGAV